MLGLELCLGLPANDISPAAQLRVLDRRAKKLMARLNKGETIISDTRMLKKVGQGKYEELAMTYNGATNNISKIIRDREHTLDVIRFDHWE